MEHLRLSNYWEDYEYERIFSAKHRQSDDNLSDEWFSLGYANFFKNYISFGTFPEIKWFWNRAIYTKSQIRLFVSQKGVNYWEIYLILKRYTHSSSHKDVATP